MHSIFTQTKKLFLPLLLLISAVDSARAQFGQEVLIDGCTACIIRSNAVADFDGDGDKDIVAYNSNSFELQLQINDGTNNFSPSALIETGSTVSFAILESADIDGDGATDVLMRSSQSPLFYYKGDGNGGLTESVPINIVPAGVTRIYPFDYENDGDRDLIFIAEDFFSVSVALNDGTGDFTIENNVETSLQTSSVTVFDLDGDGDEDVLLHPLTSVDYYWLEKQADDTYADAALFASFPNVAGILTFTADYNGDGFADAVENSSAGDYMRVYLSQGGNVYPGFYTLEAEVNFVAQYDLDYDDDGDIDLLVQNNIDDAFYFLENAGDGTFGTPVSLFSLASGHTVIASEDFNGDDLPDYLTNYGLRPVAGVMTQTPEGDYVYGKIHAQKYRGRQIFFEDLEGDGKEDFLRYSNYFLDERFSYFSNYRENELSNEVILGEELFSNYANYFDFTDFDGDGDLDMLLSYNSGYDLTWYEFTGAGYTAHTVDAGDYRYARFVDYNNDGNADILGYLYDTYEMKGFAGDGSGNFAAGEIIYTHDTFLRTFEPADLNGDGDTDFILFGDDETLTLENDGNMNYSGSVFSDIDTKIFTYADFDGDGVKDLILGNPQFPSSWGAKILSLHLGQSDGTFAAGTVFQDDFYEFKNFRAEDYDSDGDLDLFAMVRYYPGNGATYALSYFENAGDGTFSDPALVEGRKDEIESYGFFDVNGDGSKDLFQSEIHRIVYRLNLAGKPIVVGRLFADENADGQYTPGEAPLTDIPVTTEPAPVAAFADADGIVRFYVEAGEYTVSVDDAAAECWELTSDFSEYTIEIDGDTPLSDTLDFGFNLVSDESDMTPSIIAGPTRCGFTVPFWLNVKNTGCKEQPARYAMVLDPAVTFIEATPAPFAISGDTLFFAADTLPAGGQSQAQILLEMPGVDAIGSFIGLESLAFTPDEDDTYVLAKNVVFASQINCAYDPNDKQVSPSNPSFEENYTLFDEELTYTIRFQNTGTDTAFNIVIRDTLDSNLDWNTFRPLDASHAFQTQIDYDNGAVAFSFPQILLPDSIVNEPGSHGYVRYAVSPFADLEENTAVLNTAHIYFDFNPAIVTNTVTNTFVSGFFTFADIVPPACHDSEDGSITAQFPFGGEVAYSWSNGAQTPSITNLVPDNYALTITDLNGEILVDTLFEVTAPPELLLENTAQTPEINGNANGTASVIAGGGTAPYAYAWSTDPPQTEATATDLPADTYTVTITDANGCEVTTEVTVESITGTENPEAGAVLLLYPNPTAGKLLVRLLNADEANATEFIITDVNGRTVEQFTRNAPADTPAEIILQQTGVYLFTCKSEGRITATKRFVVLR